MSRYNAKEHASFVNYSHLLLTMTEGDPLNDGLLEEREIMTMNLHVDLPIDEPASITLDLRRDFEKNPLRWARAAVAPLATNTMRRRGL